MSNSKSGEAGPLGLPSMIAIGLTTAPLNAPSLQPASRTRAEAESRVRAFMRLVSVTRSGPPQATPQVLKTKGFSVPCRRRATKIGLPTLHLLLTGQRSKILRVLGGPLENDARRD